jgi:hypothetical protein
MPAHETPPDDVRDLLGFSLVMAAIKPAMLIQLLGANHAAHDPRIARRAPEQRGEGRRLGQS